MTIALAASTALDAPDSPQMALLRLNQVLEDCQNKAGDLSNKLHCSNLRNADIDCWEAPARVSKELLELLRNLEQVNDFVISKDALKPAEKSVKEALKLSLESFCHLHDACRYTKKISEDIFDSSTAALRILGNSLALLLHEFTDKLAVR